MRKLLIFSALCLAIACKREKCDYFSEPVKFTAGVSHTETTKTAMGRQAEDGSYPLLWSAGDKIAIVHSSTQAVRSVYTTSDDLCDIAEFHYDRSYEGNSRLSGDNGGWIAFYPTQSYSYSDGKHCIRFNNEQIYSPESIQSETMPMIAASENTNLQFSNLCGILRVRICSTEGSAAVRKIRLLSEAGSFCGMFTMGYDDSAMEWQPMNNDNQDANCITLDIGEEVTLSPTPSNFLIVIPPVMIPDLVIELQTVTGEIVKTARYKVPESIRIERSRIATLSVDLTKLTAINGTEIKIDDTVQALTELSYKFTASENCINIFREGATGSVKLESICHKEFSDGSISDTALTADYLFSTDGGATWTAEPPSMFSRFSISEEALSYEILPDNKDNDCLVRLIQKESGRSICLPFRQSCNAIVISYTTNSSGADSLICNIRDNNVQSAIFDNGEERIIGESGKNLQYRASLPSQETNQVIFRLNPTGELSLYNLFALYSSNLKYRITAADLSHLDMSRVTSFGNLFYGDRYLEKCLFPEGEANSALEDMSMMFYNCQSLTDVEFSTFSTSSVTNLSGTFRECKSLESLNLSGFKTGNVISFATMFSGCSKLRNLDVSGFNTGSALYFSQMFQGCSSLKSIDVSGFSSEKVINMSEMFRRSSVEYLDLSNFSFENSEDISFMLSNCSKLKSVDISEIVAPKLKNAREMFAHTGLESLSISRFKCGDNCNLYEMFGENYSLKTISLPDFDASRAANMYELFYMCTSLTQLDCSGFKTDNVTDMSSMFAWCSSLESLDVSSFSTGNVANMKSMFSSTKLKELNLSSFDTHNVTNMSDMFSSCRYLTALDLSSFNVEKVTDMSSMFSNCSQLTDINLSSFYSPSLLTTNRMFLSCEKLQTLDLSNLCTDKVTAMSRMFEKCSSLLTVDVSRFNGASLEQAGSMFSGCWCIEEINLQNLSLSKIKQSGSSGSREVGLNYMFNECRSVKYIYMDMRDSAERLSAENMFLGTYDGHTLYVKDGILNDSVKAVIPDGWTVMPF